MHRPIGKKPEDGRPFPCRAGRFDPPVGCVLGQMEDLRAVGEQRRTSFAEIQPPRNEFTECRNQSRGRLAFSAGQASHFQQEIRVGQHLVVRSIVIRPL